MKIQKTTTTKFTPEGNVRLTHSQGARQSMNYQTMEANYGIELVVKPGELNEGVEFAEDRVQTLLKAKMAEHRKVLERLSP